MSRIAPDPEQLVTSSDLVRHFGLWQERAARAPLYVLHRGRPRFVLASIETMDALCAPHAPAAAGNTTGDVDATALLDSVSDLVLVAGLVGGDDARITAASRAARAHFGGLAAVGARLDGIAPPAARAFLADAIRRVVASGIVERLELASPVRTARMLSVTLAPRQGGVALFARDGTSEREQARLRAVDQASAQAMAVAGQVATATLSPRGDIVDPAPALAGLTGLARDALATIRFVALAEIGGRAALGEAVERVLSGGGAEAIDFSLLVHRAPPVPVRAGLAAISTGIAVEGASVVLRARAALP